MRRAALLILAFILCLGLTWAGSGPGTLALRPKGEAPLKLDPRYRRLMALGFREVQADLLWLRAGIAAGQSRTTDAARLAELINQAVELDPYYYDAYRHGASFLPPEEAIGLLKKGAARFPRDWKLPEMIGFCYHFGLRDYASAARYYGLAASLPGAPPYVASLAARLHCEAGDLEAAIRVLARFRDGCQKDEVREDFGRRLAQLRNLKLLTEACEVFRSGSQRPPRQLEELLQAGILAALPADPFGGRYYLSEEGRVACDTDRNRLPG